MCCHLKLRPLWIWEGGSLMSMPQPHCEQSQAPEGGSWCLTPVGVPKILSFQACSYPEENTHAHMVLDMVRTHRINDIRRHSWQPDKEGLFGYIQGHGCLARTIQARPLKMGNVHIC